MPRIRPIALALTAAASLALAVPAGAVAEERVVKVRDACDPATFNAVLGDGMCVRDDGGSRVALESAFAAWADRGEHRAWRFSLSKLTAEPGDTIAARLVSGGEGHTFTEVESFGPGCVPEVNDLLGAHGAPAGDCALIPATLVAPGVTVQTAALDTGVHRFICLIHPWMRTTVTVRD